MATGSIEMIKLQTDELYFDHKNPRLAEYGIAPENSEEEILKILYTEMDVKELIQSIVANGFFAHEALIVAEEDNKKIVIEGNRRLAAVKTILNPEIAAKYGWQIPDIDPQKTESLKSLPAIISPREDSWRFLGFKHVNGAAKWSSYAKAKYIAHVHQDYQISLVDIASQLGDGFGTVKKLYRGLMVLQQAERTGVYNLNNRSTKRLSFSHLYTGIQYPGFKQFLLLNSDDESSSPVHPDKLQELGELCSWLYGDKLANKLPAVKSQNPHLSQLNAVLLKGEAIAVLRDTNDLERAFEFTRPSLAIFEEALIRAKRELLRAKSYLALGYNKSEDLLRTAGTIATTADSIYEEMRRMINSEVRSRITEE